MQEKKGVRPPKKNQSWKWETDVPSFLNGVLSKGVFLGKREMEGEFLSAIAASDKKKKKYQKQTLFFPEPKPPTKVCHSKNAKSNHNRLNFLCAKSSTLSLIGIRIRIESFHWRRGGGIMEKGRWWWNQNRSWPHLPGKKTSLLSMTKWG